MNLQRREFSAAVLGACATATSLMGASPASQAQSPMPVEGKDYQRLGSPLPAPSNGKIEVYDFFSYACPHCNAFGPTLDAWTKKLPADVVMHHIPVPFLINAENFQRLYFSLEAMGLVDALHRKVFAAVHVDRLTFEKPAEIAAFMTKNGVDSAKFMEVFNSFSVQTKARQATQLTQAYRLDGVPSIGIQGRYVTSPSMAGSPDRALLVANFLIEKVRSKA
jgi:protein dithiol oxidoreductase (disulfide-forming)